MLNILKKRFDDNLSRHTDIGWETVAARLNDNPTALSILQKMEDTGGEPDVLCVDDKTGEIIFCDFSRETPVGRRSLCYDEAALLSRKKNPPVGSAIGQAKEMGVTLMTEQLYYRLQTLGQFDLKTSSWIDTPKRIRDLGGALFCERRYDTIFTFHNGVESYYSVRGWRGYLRV